MCPLSECPQPTAPGRLTHWAYQADSPVPSSLDLRGVGGGQDCLCHGLAHLPDLPDQASDVKCMACYSQELGTEMSFKIQVSLLRETETHHHGRSFESRSFRIRCEMLREAPLGKTAENTGTEETRAPSTHSRRAP